MENITLSVPDVKASEEDIDIVAAVFARTDLPVRGRNADKFTSARMAPRDKADAVRACVARGEKLMLDLGIGQPPLSAVVAKPAEVPEAFAAIPSFVMKNGSDIAFVFSEEDGLCMKAAEEAWLAVQGKGQSLELPDGSFAPGGWLAGLYLEDGTRLLRKCAMVPDAPEPGGGKQPLDTEGQAEPGEASGTDCQVPELPAEEPITPEDAVTLANSNDCSRFQNP
jgi:hypothetical protein